MSLLKSLILVSEKAANVARICRQNQHLFELLIEEKKSDEKNPRFVQDFKTLADVLIQETVRHDIGNEFPDIKDEIKGEESNVFCNTLGESIAVRVLSSRNETSELLAKVLNGDNEAAVLLADEVHRDIELVDVATGNVPDDDVEVDYKQVGIWIDPIDSTAEYISGKEQQGKNKIAISGLKCVTVLIGVYDLQTGNPLIGVVNQPFVENVDDKWRGRCYWGTPKSTSLQLNPIRKSNNIVCISSSETATIKNKLESAGFKLVEAAGAGYKILTTITGSADAYLLSKDSTFKWDTCGPQAILKSLGGDIVIYNAALENRILGINYVDVEGGTKIEGSCNRGGIIAYRDGDVLMRLLDVLR